MAGATSFPSKIFPINMSCPLQETGIVPPFFLDGKILPPVQYDSDT
jgi:hypothetical protein